MPDGAEVELEVLDKALNETGPSVPPPPTLSLPNSTFHLVFGNLAVLGLVACGGTGLLPWWLVTLLAVLVAFVLAAKDPTAEIRRSYKAARTEEIQGLFGTAKEADAWIERETSSAVKDTPSVPVVAATVFILSFPVPVFVFANANASMDWSWPVRWPFAFLMALIVWAVFAAAWGFANFTPANIHADYREMRREEEEAQRLGPHDRNDIHIISAISRLDSLHRRIDAYTIESALLSALSFSAFVSIAVAEERHLSAVASLFSDPVPWWSFDPPFVVPLVGPVRGLPILSLDYLNGHVIPLICLALLFCASTFLAVLVGRLRFNDAYRDAESLLRVAERINEKEEAALDRNPQANVDAYGTAISSLLRNAQSLEKNLGFTVSHMRFSRNTGILFFVVALIMCGMFFHYAVALLISFVFLYVLLIGFLDKFLLKVRRREAYGQGALAALLKPFRGRGEP